MRRKTLHVFHATGEGFAIPLQEPPPEPELTPGRAEIVLRPSPAKNPVPSPVAAGRRSTEPAAALEFHAAFGD